MNKNKERLIYERSKLFKACANAYNRAASGSLTGDRQHDIDVLKSVIVLDDSIFSSDDSEYRRYLLEGNATPADELIAAMVKLSRDVRELKAYDSSKGYYKDGETLKFAAAAIKSFNDDELGWRNNDINDNLKFACQNIAANFEANVADKALTNFAYLGGAYDSSEIEHINEKFQSNYEALSMISQIKSNDLDFKISQSTVDSLANAVVIESKLTCQLNGVKKEAAKLVDDIKLYGVSSEQEAQEYKREARLIEKDHKAAQARLDKQREKARMLTDSIREEIKTFKAVPPSTTFMKRMDEHFGLVNNYIKDNESKIESYKAKVDPKYLKRKQKELKRQQKLDRKLARRSRRRKISLRFLILPFIWLGKGLMMLAKGIGYFFKGLYIGATYLFKGIGIAFRGIGTFFAFIFSSKIGAIVGLVVVVATAGGVGIGFAVAKNNAKKHAHEHWCIQDAGTLEKAPTCSEEGEYVYRCVRHGEVERVKLPKVHKFNESNICVDCGLELDLTGMHIDYEVDIITHELIIYGASSDTNILNIPAYIDGQPVKHVFLLPDAEITHTYDQVNIYTSASLKTVDFGSGRREALDKFYEVWDNKPVEEYHEHLSKYAKEINIIGDIDHPTFNNGTPYCAYNFIGNVNNFTGSVYCKNINFIYDIGMLSPFDRNDRRSAAIKKNTEILYYNGPNYYVNDLNVGNIYLEEGSIYTLEDDCLYADGGKRLIAKACNRYKNILDDDDYEINTYLPNFKFE